jgi:DNA-3-methyladenine glycosylase II
MVDIVPVPPDYNFKLNLEFLQRSPKELLHAVDGVYILKLLSFGKKKILTRLLPGEDIFTIDYPDKLPNDEQRIKIVTYVREWFDLDTDLGPFYKLASKDGLLKNVVAKYYGYRIVGQPDLFESITWAILGQQINLSFAYTLKQRFVETFGSNLKWDKKTFYLFPRPEVVASLSDDELLSLQFSRQKSLYVRLVAQAFRDGVISQEAISTLPFMDAKQNLMKIKGIGNWTANYALMKTFRYPNAFPLEDAGIHNAIKNLKGLQEKPSLEEVKKVFKKYQGWEAYATLYLWKSL